MKKIVCVFITTSVLLFSSQSINYKNSLDLYKRLSSQLKNECIELVKGTNNYPILIKSIQSTFWKVKNPDTNIAPIDNQSLLETFHQVNILYCKKALKQYNFSKELHDSVLKDLNVDVYFFEDFIEVLEDSRKK